MGRGGLPVIKLSAHIAIVIVGDLACSRQASCGHQLVRSLGRVLKAGALTWGLGEVVPDAGQPAVHIPGTLHLVGRRRCTPGTHSISHVISADPCCMRAALVQGAACTQQRCCGAHHQKEGAACAVPSTAAPTARLCHILCIYLVRRLPGSGSEGRNANSNDRSEVVACVRPAARS